MSRQKFGIFGIVVLVGALALAGFTSLQQQGGLNIEISGVDAGALVQIFVNSGKVGETTASTGGDAMSLLNLSNLGKIRVQIAWEQCVDGEIIIRMIEEGTEPPEDEGCDRRPIGGYFWLDEATSIVIDLQAGTVTVTSGGMSTTTKFLIGGGVAAGGVGLGLGLAGGDDPMTQDEPDTPQTPDPGGGGGGEPPAPNTACTDLNATLTGTLTLVSDGCGGFSATSPVSVECTGFTTAGGTAICVLIHISAGVPFTGHMVTGTPTTNTCTVASSSAGTGDVFGTDFLSEISGPYTQGGNWTVTQRLVGGGGCVTVYSGPISLPAPAPAQSR